MDKKVRHDSDVEIDIIPLLKALLSKIWLMALVGIIAAGIAFGAAKLLIKPTYRSSFTAYVNNQQVQTNKSYLSSSDLSAMKELVRTYSHILTSNSILTASAKSIDMDLSYSTLKKIVSTEIKNETEIITVHVVMRDPQESYDLAYAIANTAPSYMADIVEGSSMKIIDYPVYSEIRYKPSYIKYAVFGLLFGAFVVFVITIIRYFSDDTVKDENDLEVRFSIPVLGVIPDLTTDDKKTDYYSYDYSYESVQSHSERSGQNEK